MSHTPLRMTEPVTPGRWALAPLLAAAVLSGCVTTTPSPTSSVAASAAPSLQATPLPTPVASGEPTATPEPPLSLDLPEDRDRRRVRVQVSPDVPSEGNGTIVVTVTNLADRRIMELVLRWPTELRRALFLAPFEPSAQRRAEGGPPLWQQWTKWVDGPGERGEPAGTTSLGWGPLLPDATLTIPIVVTRQARGEVAFDLQVLAGESVLTLDGGGPAELRVQVP